MVSLLASASGSDVNKASYVARSRAVHWAASSSDCDGSVECLRVLLGAGADVEARVASGRTPLMLAARAGHLQAVDELIRHGGILSQISVSWHTHGPFVCLVLSCEKILVEHKTVDKQRRDFFINFLTSMTYCSPLQHLVENGS